MMTNALSGEALFILYMAIAIGTSFQITTGIGLGLFCGPALLFFLPASSAILISICLNIILSIPLAAQERGEILWNRLGSLALGTLLGIPLGWVTVQNTPKEILSLLIAGIIIFIIVQLITPKSSTTAMSTSHRFTLAGGGAAGFMSGCLALPGPMALWTLIKQGYSALEVRATLRVLFIIAYGSALGIHLGLSEDTGSSLTLTYQLLPALIIGGIIGIAAKSRLSERLIHKALLILLSLTAFFLISTSLNEGIM